MKKSLALIASYASIKQATFILSSMLLDSCFRLSYFPCKHTGYSGKNWIDYAGDNTKSRYSTLKPDQQEKR